MSLTTANAEPFSNLQEDVATIGVGELWPHIHSLTVKYILQAEHRLSPIFARCHLNLDLIRDLVREQVARRSENRRRPLGTILKNGRRQELLGGVNIG